MLIIELIEGKEKYLVKVGDATAKYREWPNWNETEQDTHPEGRITDCQKMWQTGIPGKFKENEKEPSEDGMRK